MRPTIVEGLFYPAERGRLRESVERLLSRCATPEGDCFAVVTPHAGFTYAGPVMAEAYRALSRRKLTTAVLIGPVHRDPAHAVFLPESEVFSTPLGELAVDTAGVARLLAADSLFTVSDLPHLEEHCLEVQLPFLAHLFPGVLILPMLVGDVSLPVVETIARALRLTCQSGGDYTALVVTANMASYMRAAGADSDSQTIMRLIESRDWRGIASAAEGGRTSTCGAGGVAAVLAACGEQARVERLAEADSRRIDGDPARTVHYASFGIHKDPVDHGARAH